MIEPNQEIEREDFLQQAMTHLDQKYKEIPRVILTADPSGYDTAKNYFSKEKLYRKTDNDIIKMLQYIDSLDSEIVKIRSSYPDIFEVIDNSSLPDEMEVQLIDLLKKYDTEDYSELLDNLAKVRRIQESIFQTINKMDKNILPDSLFKGNKDIKFWDINTHLKGNPSRETKHKPVTTVYYSGVIAHFSEVIYKVSSDNGAHHPYENPDNLPTTYTLKSLINSLMDFIRWFGSLVLNNDTHK